MSLATTFRKIDLFLDRQTGILLLILLLIGLRVPNLGEPYWYGDEAIYLTVGQGIKQGRTLYSEIVDHKTPLIYFLATVPNQFWFRILNLGWNIGSTIFFYLLAKKIISSRIGVWLSTLGFVLLTTLPWFEGNIPNGELFVLGFVLAGSWLVSQSDYFQNFIDGKTRPAHFNNNRLVILGGILAGLGVLTKVPALLDLGALMLPAFYAVTQNFWLNKKINWSLITQNFISLVWLGIGFASTIGLSIIYFVSQGAGQDYLKYGLLYNLHYTQTWQLSLQPAWLNFWFSLPGKMIILAGLIIILASCRAIKNNLKFALSWLALTFFAALLSNRPYPHYYIQLVPGLCLLIGLLVSQLPKLVHRPLRLKQLFWPSASWLLVATVIGLIIKVGFLLDFRPYSTAKYYQNFFRYLSGQQSQMEYFQNYNSLMPENYQLANFFKNDQPAEIFIWGTNPALYALTHTAPTGKFTVSFHIHDLKAYSETMVSLYQKPPKYIVVMKNETGAFPEFFTFLANHYRVISDLNSQTLYQKKTL